jgi:peptidoglycan DL-endopeptidase CwlO
LASHRKPRNRSGVPADSPAVVNTTAALASVTLLSTQSANTEPAQPAGPAESAEPNPSVEEVQQKVDDLYRQAGGETPKYNTAKEAAAQQRQRRADRVLYEAARSAEKLNEARRTLGSFAAAQNPEGTAAPTAALLLADGPQGSSEQGEPMERQRGVLAGTRTRLTDATEEDAQVTSSLGALTVSQASLQTSKENVQEKLATARSLLARLTAEKEARRAALERKKKDEARREAEARTKADARAQAEAARRREETAKALPPSSSPSAGASTGAGPDSGTDTGSGTRTDATGACSPSGNSGSTYAAKAAKVLAFARAQIGKPYVWGASGPSSYDCSGLTLAAWKAAGVELPRSTGHQANTGTRVATEDLLPGDLVFFYDDISHAGIYIGDGMMIHAPKPGANVREESIYYMPIYGSIRPA